MSTRQERQNAAKEKIAQVLEEYNVKAVDTLIGDITPPESLMKTLTDRKIAQEEEVTFETQRKAQDQRKTFESAKALAEMQGKMVLAQQQVEISQREAEAAVKQSEGEAKSIEIKATASENAKVVTAKAEAESITLTKQAEAVGIEAIGKANAESYKLAVESMGDDNFTKMKITEQIAAGKVRIIPEIQINGSGTNGSNGAIDGLLGLKLLEMNKERTEAKEEDVQVKETNKKK